MNTDVNVNGRVYIAPKTCAIVICLDGCEPAYLDVAIGEGLMPTLKRIRAMGSDHLAHSVIPSFTNPNNMSIATGRPPAVHGICGNYLYEPETGEEVMMNDVRFLRAPTVFGGLYNAGAKVAVVTAKDKLRALLGAGLKFDEDRAICFSSEKADQATLAENGIENASAYMDRPVPEVYREDLYYRLNVIRVDVPPLSQRKEDIGDLSSAFLKRHADSLLDEPKVLSPEALLALTQYDWPGNVRQLENTCYWIALMAPTQNVELEDLPGEIISNNESTLTQGDDWKSGFSQWLGEVYQSNSENMLEIIEPTLDKVMIDFALEKTGGKKQEAAKVLGLGRNTLTKKIKAQQT